MPHGARDSNQGAKSKMPSPRFASVVGQSPIAPPEAASFELVAVPAEAPPPVAPEPDEPLEAAAPS